MPSRTDPAPKRHRILRVLGCLALACPICEGSLVGIDCVFACANGHSFDVAKEGYVNLLPPQHRPAGLQGDAREMLQARRRFLEAGFFSPLRDLLAEETSAVLGEREPSEPPVVLETGCGEGYYVGGVGERLTATGEVRLLGTDLSKDAVRMAAKRYRDVLFFVADVNRRLYVRDASVSVLLDVFAPRNPAEFARVLEPGGSALVVIPAEGHLANLRESLGLLDIEREKERRVMERFAGAFELAERRELSFELELPPSAVHDLVEMGPNAWHERSADGVDAMRTKASFVLLRFRRSGKNG